MVAVGRVVGVQRRRVKRATGRKDRQSKVYTSKGTRDRRVRLSAVTAIQFYDVQDRLGFDRPSEAVDWLIQKAKASIEALPQKPSVDPDSVGVTCTSFEQNLLQEFGNGVENATDSSLQQIQNLQHLGVDEINIPASCSMEPSSLLSTEYVHMENSIPELNYQLGNDTADPSLAIRFQEYVMLQEESMVSLPVSSRPGCDSVPSSWLDQSVEPMSVAEDCLCESQVQFKDWKSYASLFSEQTFAVQRPFFCSGFINGCTNLEG